jgi:hypothetical protein
MNSGHPPRRCSALLFTALALLAAKAAGAAIPPAEKILPSDTLLVLTIPDCAKMRAIFEKTPQSRLWNDPAMKPFRENFMERLKEEFIAPLERDLGVKFDDYSALPQGQLTFAVTQNGWQGKEDTSPGVLLLLDAKEKSNMLKKNLAALRKNWTDSGKPIKTEKIRDVEFSIVPLSTNEVPKTFKKFFPQKQQIRELGRENEPPQDNSQIVVGQFESLLIVGSTVPVVERIVARLTGGSAPALADEAAFELDRLAFFRDAPMFAWFNAKGVFDVLGRLPEEKPNPQAPNPLPMPGPARVLNGSGLGGLKTLAFDLRDTNDGTLFELHVAAPESARAGLFKLLAADAKDAGPPPFVPADVVKFHRWRMDGQKAVATAEKMLGEVTRQGLNSWNFLLSSGEEAVKQDDPTYDIRKNLFANIGDDFIVYEKAPRANAPSDSASPPSLILIGSPNADQLCRALPGLLILRSPDALAPKTREFLGRKIYSIGLPTPTVPGATAATLTLNYAASGSYVAFSTDDATLEEYLRSAESQAKTLRESAGLAEAAQRVGGQSTGLFGYENQGETMRLKFDAWKKSPAAVTNNSANANPLTTAIPFTTPEKSFRDWMDFSLLPDYAKVSKYFSFSVWAGSANVDGITFKFFSPAPPQLKP